MVISNAQRAFTSLGLLALAPLLALSACAEPSSARAGGGNIRFAISTTAATTATAPTVRVGDVRVLSKHVNLQEPVLMGAAGREVTVTFALRQREGATFMMDAESLEPRTVLPYAYPSHPRAATPPFVSADLSRVILEDGSSLACWTDESSRVLVEAFDGSGASRGAPVAVSPEGMDAFGAPHIATADGRHAVVTFFSSDEERFQLVAASLESVR